MSNKKYDLSRYPINQRVYDLLKDDIPGWAERIGIKASTIRDSWFRNHGAISARDIKKISDATGRTCDWIIKGNEVRNGHKLNREDLEPRPLGISLLLEFMEKIKGEGDLKYHVKAMISNLERGDFEIAKMLAQRIINDLEKIEAKKENEKFDQKLF